MNSWLLHIISILRINNSTNKMLSIVGERQTKCKSIKIMQNNSI